MNANIRKTKNNFDLRGYFINYVLIGREKRSNKNIKIII